MPEPLSERHLKRIERIFSVLAVGLVAFNTLICLATYLSAPPGWDREAIPTFLARNLPGHVGYALPNLWASRGERTARQHRIVGGTTAVSRPGRP